MNDQPKTEQQVLKEFVADLMAAYANVMREERELEYYVRGSQND